MVNLTLSMKSTIATPTHNPIMPKKRKRDYRILGIVPETPSPESPDSQVINRPEQPEREEGNNGDVDQDEDEEMRDYYLRNRSRLPLKALWQEDQEVAGMFLIFRNICL